MSERVDRIMRRGIKRVSDNPPQKALSIQPRGYEADMEKAKSFNSPLREEASHFVERFYAGEIPKTINSQRLRCKTEEKGQNNSQPQ